MDNLDLIVKFRAGSYLYNLHSESSDIDYLGIFSVSTQTILRGDSYRTTLTKTGPDVYEDYTYHEIQKFMELIFKGNPGIIELLWTFQEPLVTSNLWNQLRSLKYLTINLQTYKQYLGYLKSQVRRFHNSVCAKPLSHAYRLLLEVERIIHGLPPQVSFTGRERQYLMDIKYGNVDLHLVVRELESRIAQLPDKPNLPATIDKEPFRKLLLEHRKLKLIVCK